MAVIFGWVMFASLACGPCWGQAARSAGEKKVYGEEDRRRALAALKSIGKGLDSGTIVHDANSVLGLVALQQGRLDEAKAFLLKAGATHGSPMLNSSGPSMLLARRLTERGEMETVVAYLDLVAKFWARSDLRPEEKTGRTKDEIAGRLEMNARNRKKLAEWKVLVRKGIVPGDWLWNRDPGAYL